MLKRYAVTNTGDIEEHPEGMVVLFDDVEGETYSQAHVDRLHRHREQAYEDVARISAENKALVDKLDAERRRADLMADELQQRDPLMLKLRAELDEARSLLGRYESLAAELRKFFDAGQIDRNTDLRLLLDEVQGGVVERLEIK